MAFKRKSESTPSKGTPLLDLTLTQLHVLLNRVSEFAFSTERVRGRAYNFMQRGVSGPWKRVADEADIREETATELEKVLSLAIQRKKAALNRDERKILDFTGI